MKLTSNEIDVQKEDQAKINTFSRLNMQFHDKVKLLAKYKIVMNFSKKEQLMGYDDALEEMELMDDEEKIQYKFGDCFFSVTSVQVI